MKTYNKAIFMPSHTLDGKRFRLTWSKHAIESLSNDRYGAIRPILEVTVNRANLVELTLNDYKNPVKLMLRTKQDVLNDVCLVFIPDYDVAFVKSAWLCRADDNHTTLNRSLYATN